MSYDYSGMHDAASRPAVRLDEMIQSIDDEAAYRAASTRASELTSPDAHRRVVVLEAVLTLLQRIEKNREPVLRALQQAERKR